MAISSDAYYLLTPCCDQENSFQLFWDESAPSLPNGVYQYLGEDTNELIFQQCYTITFVQEAPSETEGTLVPSSFENLNEENCDSAFEAEKCFCLDSVKVVNCFDETLGFDFVPQEGTELNLDDVISLDLMVGDPIVLGDDNLCVDTFGIFHPQINPGAVDPTFFSGTAVKQLNLYNGKPYYLFTLTEDDHGVPGLVLTYYFIWNSSLSRWEVWPNFNIFTGPSNPECNNLPFMALVPGTFEPPDTNCSDPIASAGLGCVYASVGNTTECDTYVSGIREVAFCEEEVTIGDFINCWKVIAFTATKPTHPTISVTQEHDDCEDCIESKNEPPCIKLTDCRTGTEILLTSTEVLESYIGQTITVDIDGTRFCYLVEISEDCPEEATLLVGEILDSHINCAECIANCLELINCETDEVLYYLKTDNLIPYINQIIQVEINGSLVCYTVRCGEDCPQVLSEFTEEILDSFVNCKDCLPPVRDFEPTVRAVMPGYTTGLCDPDKVEKIKCTYGELMYQHGMSRKYMIKYCCQAEEWLWTMRHEKIKLYLTELSNPTPDSCNPVCRQYQYRFEVSEGGSITYTDCDGNEEQITVTANTEESQFFDFCALDYPGVIINLVSSEFPIGNAFTIQPVNDCQ
jgi:hypothetical protein